MPLNIKCSRKCAMPDLPGGSSAEPLRYQTICVTTGARRSGMTTISRPFASFACVIAGPAGLPCACAEGFRKTLSRAAAVSPKDIPAIAFKGGPSLSRKRAGVPVGPSPSLKREGLSKYRMEFQKAATFYPAAPVEQLLTLPRRLDAIRPSWQRGQLSTEVLGRCDRI